MMGRGRRVRSSPDSASVSGRLVPGSQEWDFLGDSGSTQGEGMSACLDPAPFPAQAQRWQVLLSLYRSPQLQCDGGVCCFPSDAGRFALVPQQRQGTGTQAGPHSPSAAVPLLFHGFLGGELSSFCAATRLSPEVLGGQGGAENGRELSMCPRVLYSHDSPPSALSETCKWLLAGFFL